MNTQPTLTASTQGCQLPRTSGLRFALLTGLLALLALPGRAVTLTYNGRINSTPVNWATQITVPQFNRSLGSLTGVRITLSGEARAVVLAENLGATAATPTVSSAVTFALKLFNPGFTRILGRADPAGSFEDVLTLGAFDGTQNFQGASAGSATHLLQYSQVTYHDRYSVVLPLFIGTNVVVLPCEGFVSAATASSGAGIATGFNNQTDLNVTVVYEYIGYGRDPILDLSQAVDKPIVGLGENETFRFGLWNYTAGTVTDVQVINDNGTPADPSDDVVVGTQPSLAAGSGTSFVYARPLPARLEATLNGQRMDVGTLCAEFLANGDLSLKFRQSRNVGDNTYGARAVGYPKGHKFGDLTGSDAAQFRIRDAKGNIVLEFKVDYLSAASGFASGYGTLGVSGGDGKMIIGSAASIKSITTTMSDNINRTGNTGYKTDSPAEPNANWEYAVGYDVVVNGTSFGPNGFGSVQVVKAHNSPSKLGYNDVAPVTAAACFVNSAKAYARYVDVIGSGDAAVTVCVEPPCVSGFSRIKKDFNSTAIATGRRIWFNSVVKLSGRTATQAASLRVDTSTVEFTLNGAPVTVDVPAAVLNLDPAATTATTAWDSVNQMWVTRVPAKYTGDVFLTGTAYTVPANITTAIKGVEWTGRFSQAAAANVVPEWKWAAAVYTSWGATPAALGVKPINGKTLNPYANDDLAGTPESYKTYVTGGATGGGGSNYTGSYTGAVKVTAPCAKN